MLRRRWTPAPSTTGSGVTTWETGREDWLMLCLPILEMRMRLRPIQAYARAAGRATVGSGSATGVASKPLDEPVPVDVQGQGDGHDDGRQHDHLDVVAGRRVGTLRRRDPCVRDTAERGHEREDPERHGAQAEEVAGHVLREARNHEDHETEDGPFSLDDEAQLLPDLGIREPPNVPDAEPSTDAERRERSQGEADRRVEQSPPFAEEVAAQDPRELPRNRSDDDLQGLKTDEHHGRENAPLAKRVLEELPVRIEAGHELIR